MRSVSNWLGAQSLVCMVEEFLVIIEVASTNQAGSAELGDSGIPCQRLSCQAVDSFKSCTTTILCMDQDAIHEVVQAIAKEFLRSQQGLHDEAALMDTSLGLFSLVELRQRVGQQCGC